MENNIFSYSKIEKLWFKYNGKKWEKDVNGILIYVGTLLGDKDKEPTIGTKDRKEKELRFELAIPGELNQNSEILLNTPAGVIDFRKEDEVLQNEKASPALAGQYTHDLAKDNYLTDITTSEINPEDQEEPKIFLDFVFNVLAEKPKERNDPIVDYVLKWMASLLVGGVVDQKVLVFYGSANNGKTTLLNVIEGLLGSYVGNLDPLVFSESKSKSPQTIEKLYEMRHKRLTILSEPNSTMVLNTSLLKTVSGSDPISKPSIKSYEDHSFIFRSKLVFNTNHLPKIPDLNDQGLWRRLVVIPFNAKGDRVETNDYHLEILKERNQILSYLLKNYYPRWKKEGLKNDVPAISKVAELYLKFRNDPIDCFIKNACRVTSIEIDRELQKTATDLYKIYLDWCGEFEKACQKKLRVYQNGISDSTGIIFGTISKFSNTISGTYRGIKSKSNFFYWNNIIVFHNLSLKAIDSIIDNSHKEYETILNAYKAVADDKNKKYIDDADLSCLNANKLLSEESIKDQTIIEEIEKLLKNVDKLYPQFQKAFEMRSYTYEIEKSISDSSVSARITTEIINTFNLSLQQPTIASNQIFINDKLFKSILNSKLNDMIEEYRKKIQKRLGI